MAETITGLKRTHYCGELRPSDIGKEAVVFGWVQRQRDLGKKTILHSFDSCVKC